METQKTLFDDVIKAQTAQDGVVALVTEAHRNALAHGFYDEAVQMADKLRPTGSFFDVWHRTFLLAQASRLGQEVGEVDKAIRKKTDRDVLEELADIVIVAFDLAGFMAPPEVFAHALLSKMQTNIGRDRLHGGKC